MHTAAIASNGNYTLITKSGLSLLTGKSLKICNNIFTQISMLKGLWYNIIQKSAFEKFLLASVSVEIFAVHTNPSFPHHG